MGTVNAFLVEDNPVLRESLSGTLEELTPVRVVGSADDEQGAVAWLRDHRDGCDLVVIDIFLKRGSGLGVLLAAHEIDRSLKLVVLSNWATPDMRRRCLELGASQVFDKSGEIDELIGYCSDLAA